MVDFIRSVLFALLAPPAPVVDLFRALRMRGRGLLVIDLPTVQAGSRSDDGLAGLLTTLDLVRRDPMVRAVRLKLRGTAGGWATLQAVRVALVRLQEAGKPVFAELESIGNADLYLASAAKRVFLVPIGELHAGGLAARMTFFGRALQRVGLDVEVLSAGAYKSLGEPFTRAFPSLPHRDATGLLVGDLQQQMLEGIAAGRNLTVAQVVEAMEAIPLSAEQSLACGLVDELAYSDQVGTAIDEALDFNPRTIGFNAYRRWMWLRGLHRRLVGRPHNVAVVHLEGSVVMQAPAGGRGHWIAADQVTQLLGELRRMEDIGAVVLAVESGGGSGLASDLIWRAVCRLQEVKPVMAVFCNVAASGGYYIAAPASEIFAQPGTLTGSIGVVAGKLVAGGAMARLGVHETVIKTLDSADMEAGGRAFSAVERERLERSIERAYVTFLDRVASGRKRPRRAVEPHAGGRVWTGRQAMERGLVDHMGGVDDAWRRACVLANLPATQEKTGRIDIRMHSAPTLQRALQRVLFGAMAFDSLALLSMVGHGTEGLWQMAHLFSRHPAEPLAWLPWDIQVD